MTFHHHLIKSIHPNAADNVRNASGGRLFQTIGTVPAKVKIGLMNLSYNSRRLVMLDRMAAT